MPGDDRPFVDPPWGAPLDPEAVIARLPAEAAMRGMFLTAVVERARLQGKTLPSARDRYLPFEPYPLWEHCRLLVELARAVWPDQPLRQGLRRIGRGAAKALVGSTLGRVTVGSAEGVQHVLHQMAKSFTVIAQPGTITVAETGAGRAILELRGIHFFLDCHHVGVYEGALRYAEAPDARVRIRTLGPSDADFLCEWTAR